jgi:hypothetical protein
MEKVLERLSMWCDSATSTWCGGATCPDVVFAIEPRIATPFDESIELRVGDVDRPRMNAMAAAVECIILIV